MRRTTGIFRSRLVGWVLERAVDGRLVPLGASIGSIERSGAPQQRSVGPVEPGPRVCNQLATGFELPLDARSAQFAFAQNPRRLLVETLAPAEQLVFPLIENRLAFVGIVLTPIGLRIPSVSDSVTSVCHLLPVIGFRFASIREAVPLLSRLIVTLRI
jgi:hypothetical protein